MKPSRKFDAVKSGRQSLRRFGNVSRKSLGTERPVKCWICRVFAPFTISHGRRGISGAGTDTSTTRKQCASRKPCICRNTRNAGTRGRICLLTIWAMRHARGAELLDLALFDAEAVSAMSATAERCRGISDAVLLVGMRERSCEAITEWQA